MPILKLKSHPYDELYTPTVAMMPLIKHLPSWANRIWCPCDKPDSKIVLALQAAGKEVICTHIDDGHDFFTYEPERGSYDMIITNPPYSVKDAFIKRCVGVGSPWALLLPVDALSGEKRAKIYENADGVGCITIMNRLDFTGKGANWFFNAWICSWPEINGKWIREVAK